MNVSPHRRLALAITHGTRYAFVIHGCRCGECRAWMSALRASQREQWNEYMARYRARNRDRINAANREWMRRYRAARRVLAEFAA